MHAWEAKREGLLKLQGQSGSLNQVLDNPELYNKINVSIRKIKNKNNNNQNIKKRKKKKTKTKKVFMVAQQNYLLRTYYWISTQCF
jgi:predicted RNA-binding protein with RPS1 domain